MSKENPAVPTHCEEQIISWGSVPQRMHCFNCKTDQVSTIRKKIGLTSWIITGITAYILLIFGLLPCVAFALLVLLIGAFKDVEHVCPNCGVINGVYKQIK